ncbi:hypothetical protein Aperf_G00000052112 [Anoplocephala perfoliata]
MPAIILFRRGWHFSSDDFVLSSPFVIWVRILGMLLVGLPTLIYGRHEPYVPYAVLYLFFGALAVNVVQIALCCILTYASSRGGIAEVEKRKHVPLLIYLYLLFNFCELIVYSTLLYVETSSSNCLSNACIFIRVACILAIVLVCFNLIVFLTTYDSTGRVWCHHPDIWCMEESVGSHRLDRVQAHRLSVALWRRRIRCLACLGNSCGRLNLDTEIGNRNAMVMISELVGAHFMTNLVATDLLAGLMLLRWQTQQWVSCGNRVPLECILQDSYPYDPVTDNPHSVNRQCELENPSDRLANDWLGIRRLWIYSKFGTAVYGRLLYLFSKRLSPIAVSKLCHYIRCPCNTLTVCCCARQRGDDSETDPFLHQSEDFTMGCCICQNDNCNLAVYQELTERPLESVVYYSFSNNMYKSPFFVAFDDETESIVVAVRGTLSLEDALVDMLVEGNHLAADEIPPDVSAEDGANFFVHMGMLSTARNLRDIILREQLIEKARVHRPDYPLVICGHSLGAGVASVLAFLLRKYYSEVKAYAYSPPLGLMSSKMAHYCKPFVVSIVLGYDIVPRLSIPTFNDLKWRLLSALQDCNVPKYKILSNAARILSLNCLFCSRHCANSIGVDSRLFSANIQHCLLHPKVYSPRRVSISSLTAETPTLLPEDEDVANDRTHEGGDTGSQRNISSSLASAQRPVRYLAERRSLFRWLRSDSDVLLGTNASGSSCLPFISPRKASSTACSADSNEPSETTHTHLDLVSMDTSVSFAGLTLHIVEVEDSGLTASASTIPNFWKKAETHDKCPPVAIWTNSCQFQSILVHPRMLLDHFPGRVCSALFRIFSASNQTGSPVFMYGAQDSVLDSKGLIRRIKKPPQ